MQKNKLLLDFYKKHNRLPRFNIDFAEIYELLFVTPPERIKKIIKKKSKRLKITYNWDELKKEVHDKAFTVAKVMNADVLQDVVNFIQKSIENNVSFEEFKKNAPKDLIRKMQSAGWTGKSPSRLELIYKTNLQMAAAYGKYKQFYLLKDIYPNLEYRQIERKTKRHDHSILHGRIFSWDDPILNTIAPPSAFWCGCTLTPTNKPATKNNDLKLNLKEFYLSPLQQWTPDFNKYSDKLKEQLIKSLKVIR